jgi:hypothetical protein
VQDGPDGRDQRPRLRPGMDRSSACAALSPTQAEIDRAWRPRPKPLSLEERRQRERRPAPERELEEGLEEPRPVVQQQIKDALRSMRR